MCNLNEILIWTIYVAKKASKGIGMIQRMKAFAPQSTLISVYNAIILPYFDYSSPRT